MFFVLNSNVGAFEKRSSETRSNVHSRTTRVYTRMTRIVKNQVDQINRFGQSRVVRF